ELLDGLLHRLQVGLGGTVLGEDPGRAPEHGGAGGSRPRRLPTRHRMPADEPRQMAGRPHDRALHPGDVGDQGVGVEVREGFDDGSGGAAQHDQVELPGGGVGVGDGFGHRAHLLRLGEGARIGVPAGDVPAAGRQAGTDGGADEPRSEDQCPVQIEMPSASAMARIDSIISTNSDGRRAWAPSTRAVSGVGWTSTMMASAPAATAARASGATSSRFPPACDGSTSTGRCDIDLRSGTAVMSRVLREAVSKVRIPRSARMICWFPSLYTYSAALSHSSI